MREVALWPDKRATRTKVRDIRGEAIADDIAVYRSLILGNVLQLILETKWNGQTSVARGMENIWYASLTGPITAAKKFGELPFEGCVAYMLALQDDIGVDRERRGIALTENSRAMVPSYPPSRYCGQLISFFAMKSFHACPSESRLTLRMTSGCPWNFLAIPCICGSAARQGPHQTSICSSPMRAGCHFEIGSSHHTPTMVKSTTVDIASHKMVPS